MRKRSMYFSVISALCVLAMSLTACGGSAKSESYDMAVNEGYYSNDVYYDSVEEYMPEVGYMEEAKSEADYGMMASGSTGNLIASNTTSSKGNGTDGGTTDATGDVVIINGEKLVYTCNLEIETLTYDKSIQRIRENIEKYEGFVESENEYDDAHRWYYEDYTKTSGTKHMSLTVRIPTKYYNEFLSGIEGDDKVISKNSYVDNISRQYYDTSARIEALEIQLERLLEMMEQAKEIEDMITIEARLSEVQYQLNSARTSLAAMDADVAFSTITINVQEVMEYTRNIEPVKKNTFGDRLKNTLSETWDFFWEMLEGLLFLVIRLLPIALVCGVVTVVIVLIVKSNKKKKMKKMQALQQAYQQQLQNQQNQQ